MKRADASPPGVSRRLRDFGAVGDGRTDDTAALQRALANSDRYCLDGEDRVYRVNGTLQTDKNLCLRNVSLVQSIVPFDTTRYIHKPCPVTLDPSAVVDCGDPPIPPEDLPRLRASLSVRTLLIRPSQSAKPIRVNLDHVKVDRGRYPEGGSRADSAGIYLAGADGVSLRNVEITGYGKGYGLIVLHSRNVTVDDLWVHDLVWAPYAGDTPLKRARIAAIGWNSAPIHEFRATDQNGHQAPKFYGVRVQEQVTCVLFSYVQKVTIRNARVSRCLAQFDGGDLPWQADGLDVSRSSSGVTIDGAQIDSTWNGMDIVGNGTGIDGLVIRNANVSNSFTFALKLGYRLRNASITNVKVKNAGVAGIVLYGPVSGITVNGAVIEGPGVFASNGRLLAPSRLGTRAGIRIDRGSLETPSGQGPTNVLVENSSVSGANGSYEVGLLNTGGVGVRAISFRAEGFSKSEISGVGARP